MDPILNPEEEGPKKPALERLIENVREGLIGVLYVMSKGTRGSVLLAIVVMIIDAAQQCRLATARIIDVRLPTSPRLAGLFNGANIFAFNQWGIVSDKVARILAIVLVALLLLNVAYVGHSWISKNFNQIWPVRILRSTASFLVGVLYIPIITVFAEILTCRGLPADQCVAFRPIVIVLCFFFIPFALANKATAFDSRPYGNDPLKMPHSRVVFYHQVIRTVYSLMAGILAVAGTKPINITTVNIWAIIMTCLSASLLFAYVWLQPYYNHQFNVLIVLLMSFVFWLAATFLFHGAIADYAVDDEYHVVFFYCGLAMFLPLVQFVTNSRRQALLLSACNSSQRQLTKSAFDVELKMRLKLEDATVSAAARAQPGADADIDSKVLKEIGATYQEAVSNLPESSLICMFHAQFLLHTMKNPLLARRALLLTESRKPSLDESFLVFKAKKQMEENTQGGDIMNYVLGEKHVSLSKMYDRRCCEMLVAFWAALGEPEIDVANVQELAGQISLLAEQAKTSYIKLLKLRPNDPELLETYSGFAGSIGNDPDEAQRLLVRANDLRTRLTKRNAQQHGGAEVVFDETSSGILTVDASGGLENGRILGANQQAGRVFNQHSDFLISKNIATLLLPPLNQPDEFVSEFLDHGDDSFFGKTFQTFVKTGINNTILPCSIRMTPFTTDGINFRIYVYIKDDPESRMNKVAVVDPITGNVLGLTGSLLQHYPAFREASVEIETLLPGYREVGATFRTANGANVEKGPLEGCHLVITSTKLHGEKSPDVDMLSFRLPDQEGPSVMQHIEDDDMLSDDDFDDRRSMSDDDFADEAPRHTRDRADSDDKQEDKPYKLSILNDKQIEGAPGRAIEVDNLLSNESEVLLPEAQKSPTSGSVAFKMTKRLSWDNTEETQGKLMGTTGKQASVHSEATSVATASGIRRVMLATQHELEPELGRFRRLYIYTILIAGVFVIGLFVVRNQQLTEGFQKNISDLPKAGSRRLKLVEVSYLVHSLTLLGQGYVLPAGITEHVAREKLMLTVEELHDADGDLFEGRYQSSAKILRYYENPAVVMRSLKQGEEIRTEHTLFDASTMVTAKAKLLYYTPLNEITPQSPLVYFLVNNVRPIVVATDEHGDDEHGDDEHGDGEHDDENIAEELIDDELAEEGVGEDVGEAIEEAVDESVDEAVDEEQPADGDRRLQDEDGNGPLICPQLPSLAPWEIANGYTWNDPPPAWICAPERFYELLNADLKPNATCDCGCGIIDPDCGYQLPSCSEQAWNPEYVHMECEGVTESTEEYFCRLESGRCFKLPSGLQNGKTDWTCIPDVFNELSDDLTSLNDCDCNCGGLDADCARSTFNDIYCSDQLDESGAPIAIPYGTGYSCSLNPRTGSAFCIHEDDEVDRNAVVFGSNSSSNGGGGDVLVCPQLPSLAPHEIANGYSWSEPPEEWICLPEKFWELQNFALKEFATCDCGCGVIDPDCGYQLPSCSEQAWKPEYVSLLCELDGDEVPIDQYFCRLESGTCFELPIGLRNGRTDWTCIPDVYNELSDPLTSLNDCDCNCGGLDEDCAKSFNDIYCSDQVDESGAPIAIPYGSGFYCSLNSATGVAYCVEDGDTAGHGAIAFGHGEEDRGNEAIGLLEALDATTSLFSHESDQTIKQINLISLILAIVTVLVLTILLAATLAPMVLRMDANTAAVFHQLVDMPSYVFPVVGKRYTDRLIKVHDSIAAELDQDVSGKNRDKQKKKAQQEEDSDEESGSNSPRASRNKKKHATSNDDDDDDDDHKKKKKGFNLLECLGKCTSCCRDCCTKCCTSSKTSKKKKVVKSLDEALRRGSKRSLILLQMSVTLFVAIIYFTGTLWVSYTMADNMEDAPLVTNVAGLRRAAVSLTMHRLRIYVTGGKMNGGFYMDGSDVTVALDFTYELQLALMVGDEEQGIRGLMREENTDDAQTTLLFEDGCAVELEQFMPPDWLEPCDTFYNGITKHGLAGMYQHWVDSVTELVEYAGLLNADHSTSTYRDLATTNQTLTEWEQYTTLATLEAHYLQPLLKNSVDAYVAYTNSIIATTEQQQLWALVALILVVITYDFLIVQKLVQSLDNEMKRTRSLLLMIPDDVLSKLPGLKRFLMDQAASVAKRK